MRYHTPFVVVSMLLAAFAGSGPAAAGPHGPSTGKVNVQDLHFSSRAEAVAGCPAGVAAQPDGSFACGAPHSEPAGMAINEKGTAGIKSKPATPK